MRWAETCPPPIFSHPHPCECAQGKGDSAEVIQLRVLKWGDYPGLLRHAQSNPTPSDETRHTQGSVARLVPLLQKGRIFPPCEDGPRVAALKRGRAQGCGKPLEAVKGKEREPPQEPRERNTALADTLTSTR